MISGTRETCIGDPDSLKFLAARGVEVKQSDGPIQDAIVEDDSVERKQAHREKAFIVDDARQTTLPQASLMLVPHGELPLFGSAEFFARAAEELWTSTEHGLELGGAVYARQHEGRTLLVGLQRKATGLPGKVAIDVEWGSILWHTHPGVRGSLAAFSSEDLDVARQSGKPLLVIGFGGLSPDVITTFSVSLGLRGLMVSAGLKGILALEKYGYLRRRLLALGVAARVCYPSGQIQPVLRTRASPLQHAIDDMSFVIDRSVGAVERYGQKTLRRLIDRVFGSRTSNTDGSGGH